MTIDWQNSLIERLSDTCIDDMGISNLQKKYQREDVPTIFEMDWAEQNQTLEAELSTLRTQAIADAARIAELEASLAARGEALEFMKGAQQEWYEMYMQKRDAISRFKAGLIRAGARVPIDAMTMNPNEQGLTAALVYLESELDQAAKRKYDLASIVSREGKDDEN